MTTNHAYLQKEVRKRYAWKHYQLKEHGTKKTWHRHSVTQQHPISVIKPLTRICRKLTLMPKQSIRPKKVNTFMTLQIRKSQKHKRSVTYLFITNRKL